MTIETMLAEIEALLAELRIELDDVTAGRRPRRVNADLITVAIAIRVRLARRTLRVADERVTALEHAWLALSRNDDLDAQVARR